MADLHVNTRWNNEEIEILKTFYPMGGYKAVQEKLPHRKTKAISEKARSLGVSSDNKKIYFSDEEIEVLKKHYPLGGLELVKKYLPNRSDEVIYNKASKLKLKCRNDLYSFEEDEIIREHYPKYGLVKVKELLPHRDKQSIHNRAFSLGVKYLTYNKDYFETIDNPDKAYWLGFMFTDGYVTTNNRWGVTLSSKDESHLQKFLNAFECNSKIRIRERKENFGYNNGAIYKECSFMINNSKMHKDLIEKGVVRNKTHSLKYPLEDVLPKHLYSHFIRGLFDGDGSYVFYEYDSIRKDRNNKVSKRINKEISFVCASADFINQLSNILKENCGISAKVYQTSRDNLFVMRITNKKDIKLFIEYLYNDSSTHLDRKFEKAQEILEHCLT